VTLCESEIASQEKNENGIVIPVVVIAGFIGLVFGVWVWRKSRKLRKNEEHSSQELEVTVQVPENVKHVHDIEVGAPIGSGHFGDVLMGTWQGTTTVALKKPKTTEGFQEVHKESALLGYFPWE
jgi:hypothetical protein